MGLLQWLRSKLKRVAREQRGSPIVLFSTGMTLFVALSAVDVGRMYAFRQQLKVVADGAVLAAARSLPDAQAARAAAQDILNRNGVPQSGASSQISVAPDGSSAQVSLRRSFGTTFAQILGITSSWIPATSSALSGPANKVTGIVPLGVPNQTFTYGALVTLKYSSDNNQLKASGNFGALSLSGNGAGDYEQDLEYGYGPAIRVGDWLTTKPGNMVGPTDRGIAYRVNQAPEESWTSYAPHSPRLAFLPIVDFAGVIGRGQVQVPGFAAFFLEGSQGGTVTGRFLRAVTEADVLAGGTDYGLRAIKLTQ